MIYTRLCAYEWLLKALFVASWFSWQQSKNVSIFSGSLVAAMTIRTTPEIYSKARQVRVLEGHDAAMPIYQAILDYHNPTDRTAATWIARSPNSMERHARLATSYDDPVRCQAFTRQLRQWNFTTLGICKQIFGETLSSAPKRALSSSAPLYLSPLRAGAQVPAPPSSPLEVCMHLFLLGAVIPKSLVSRHIDSHWLSFWQESGVAFEDNGFIVPYCHIMPVDVSSKTSNHGMECIYLLTDLHPNVLSLAKMNETLSPVMYIGPDSLALVDHFTRQIPNKKDIFDYSNKGNGSGQKVLVDIGTGSGIQALSAAMILRDLQEQNTQDDAWDIRCVDINRRALQVTRWNFLWNALPEPTCILGDVGTEGGKYFDIHTNVADNTTPWDQILDGACLVLANPPFLPVPTNNEVISKRRHGLFSSGGGSGQDILKRIVQLASRNLIDDGGSLAVVSEFMNPSTTCGLNITSWWTFPWVEKDQKINQAAVGLLLTNGDALDASTYASRRGDSPKEVEEWGKHLEREKITHISPGLLFIQKRKSAAADLDLICKPIPKTRDGSIWTPGHQEMQSIVNSALLSGGYFGK